MKLTITHLRQSIGQNVDLIKDFQELIDLEEKSVAEGNGEPIDITFLKKFNTIQLVALETCQKLLDKYEPVLKEQESKQAEERHKKMADSKTVANNQAKAAPRSSPKEPKEIAEAIDLFAAFEDNDDDSVVADEAVNSQDQENAMSAQE